MPSARTGGRGEAFWARMKSKDVVKLAISVAWICGSGAARVLSRLAGRRSDPRLVVLYYHGVPATARTTFARQMAALTRRATVVPAAHRGPLPHRSCVAITFDDAFRSVYDYAIPELRSRSLPATVFVPVDFVGRPSGWVSESHGASGAEHVMTVEELRSLPSLVEVGSHTLTHPHLRMLDDATLRTELYESRLRLGELVGSSVSLLAFPYGEHDARVVQACREAGYERVFAVEPRHADASGRDFVHGRVSVDPHDGPLAFYLKAHGAYAWMTYASALKRRILRRGISR